MNIFLRRWEEQCPTLHIRTQEFLQELNKIISCIFIFYITESIPIFDIRYQGTHNISNITQKKNILFLVVFSLKFIIILVLYYSMQSGGRKAMIRTCQITKKMFPRFIERIKSPLFRKPFIKSVLYKLPTPN